MSNHKNPHRPRGKYKTATKFKKRPQLTESIILEPNKSGVTNFAISVKGGKVKVHKF